MAAVRLKALKTVDERIANQHSPRYYFIEKMITTLYQFRHEYKGGRVPTYVAALIKLKNKFEI